MPQDLQRYVSQLREIELEKRGGWVRTFVCFSLFLSLSDLFQETARLKTELMEAVKNGSKRQMLLFRKLQECLLEVREVGNGKLETSAQMLDTVSGGV